MESNSSDDFKAINTLAYAMMGGLALFAAVVYFMNTSDAGIGAGPIFDEKVDLLAVGGFSLMCLVMSRVLSEKLLGNTPQEKRANYTTAMGTYRSGVILRFALLEGAGLVACVFALVTGNLNLLLITCFMLVMMWTRKPSETEFAEWRG